MPIENFLIISLVAIIQSIFGVGLLLFGTPLLLLMNINFLEAISILLPCSIIVNSQQILRDWQHINWRVVSWTFFCTLPFIFVGLQLTFIYDTKLYLTKAVGILLVGYAMVGLLLKPFSFNFGTISNMLYFSLMGIIHGLSNLGGSLLSMFVSNRLRDKSEVRVTIAVCYIFFAVMQVGTLVISHKWVMSHYSFAYIGIVLVVSFVTSRFIFGRIKSERYRVFFNGLLFMNGLVLLLKK